MESTSQNHPSPATIMQIGTGYWASKILLAAVEFELFTLLATKGSMSGANLKKHLNLACTDRHFFDFLDTLTSFGFLQREGIWDSARYSNGTDTDVFLDKNKPSYLGGILEMMNHRLYPFWGNLEEGLKTGLPQNEIKEGVNLFEALYSDPDRLREFINAMSGIQKGNFQVFAEKFDFSPYKTLVDVGGSAGYLSAFCALKNPHLHCTSFDLPQVEPIAKETISQFNLGARLTTASGDFFTDALPKADMIVMGNILHDWDEKNKQMLVQKAFDALPIGGAFVAIESVIDDDRRKNPFGMMMSLNMLIETGTGFDYSFPDFNRWAKAAGFSKTELLPLAGPSSAAIAYK